jgi:hypothetical protein
MSASALYIIIDHYFAGVAAIIICLGSISINTPFALPPLPHSGSSSAVPRARQRLPSRSPGLSPHLEPLSCNHRTDVRDQLPPLNCTKDGPGLWNELHVVHEHRLERISAPPQPTWLMHDRAFPLHTCLALPKHNTIDAPMQASRLLHEWLQTLCTNPPPPLCDAQM